MCLGVILSILFAKVFSRNTLKIFGGEGNYPVSSSYATRLRSARSIFCCTCRVCRGKTVKHAVERKSALVLLFAVELRAVDPVMLETFRGLAKEDKYRKLEAWSEFELEEIEVCVSLK